jgi:very-short-patch-repair endonuclease
VEHCREVAGIPVTDPVSTLVDLAACIPDWRLERAINEADRLDLVDPETLRATIDLLPPRPGFARLRRLLGGQPLTDSGLERRFLAIVRLSGMPMPETQAWVHGYRVDFYWPHLELIVEADGWRYHRTAGEQATDHRRDHAHITAGMTTLRFAEEQIRYEPSEVKRTLRTVADQLGRGAPPPSALLHRSIWGPIDPQKLRSALSVLAQVGLRPERRRL